MDRLLPLGPVHHAGFLRALGLWIPDSNVQIGGSDERGVKNNRRVAWRDAQIEYAFGAAGKSTYKLSKTYETHTTPTIHTPPRVATKRLAAVLQRDAFSPSARRTASILTFNFPAHEEAHSATRLIEHFLTACATMAHATKRQTLTYLYAGRRHKRAAVCSTFGPAAGADRAGSVAMALQSGAVAGRYFRAGTNIS